MRARLTAGVWAARANGTPGIALAWLAGTLAVHALARLPAAPFVAALAALAGMAAFDRRARWLAIAMLAFAWTAWCAAARLDARLPAELAGRDFTVSGWVDAFPDVDAERSRFSFRVVEPRPDGVPTRLRLSWYGPDSVPAAGQALELVVRLRPPRGFANAGGFDYERWLFVEGYGATGYVRAGHVRPDAPGPIARRWLRGRAALAARIEAAVPAPRAAALIVALTVGERHGFDDAEWAALRRTGTSHLVAISGMHVGLLAGLAFVGLRRLALASPGRVAVYDLELASGGAALVALAYAALAGFAVPTQRAAVMVVVAAAVLASRRRIGAFDGLGAAAVAVLLLDPFAPLTASFWLSFGAVALLLLIARGRPLLPPRHRLAARAAQLVRLQLYLSFALVPLTVASFGEIALIAPLVNLVAIPVFCGVLVPLSLAGAALAGVPALAAPLLAVAGAASELAWAALTAAAALPWAATTLPAAPAGAVALAVIAVTAALPAHGLPARWLACCGLLPLLVPPAGRVAHGTAAVTVFDVGHGLAVLVETRGHRLLYDAGPRFRSGFDAGREIVVPALARSRRRPLDMLVLSHAHADHIGGADAVIAAFPGVQLLRGPDVERSGGAVCRRGQRWHWDGVEFAVLHPPDDFAPQGNDSSCVLRVATATTALLLTGDIEARAERLLSTDSRMRADVVVVPHHGSATSSTRRFVTASDARFAVVSVDFDSRWGLPQPDVVERWDSHGADIVATGSAGQIDFHLGFDTVERNLHRAERRRYWHAVP